MSYFIAQADLKLAMSPGYFQGTRPESMCHHTQVSTLLLQGIMNLVFQVVVCFSFSFNHMHLCFSYMYVCARMLDSPAMKIGTCAGNRIWIL